MNLKKITTEAKSILIVEDTLNNHITKEEQKELEICYDTEIEKILEFDEPYLYDLLINFVEILEDNDGLPEEFLRLKVLKLWLRKKRKEHLTKRKNNAIINM